MKRNGLLAGFRGRPLPVGQARRRRHGQRGVTALEFAIVGPTAIFILVFAIEMAVLLMSDATLGRVAADISRRAQLEQLSRGSCASDIRALLKSGMKGWVFKDEAFIVEQVRVYYPRDEGAQGPLSGAPVRCTVAKPGGAVVYKVGFTSPGFSGVLKIFKINVMRFERNILIQNPP